MRAKRVLKMKRLVNRKLMNAEQYKAARERLKLTQADLAAALGVSRKTVNARERGAVPVSAEAAFAMRFLLVSFPPPP